MNNKMQIEQYKKYNILFLRRHLNFTQKDFIREFMTDDLGNELISSSTLSNLESRGGARLDDVLTRVSAKLGIDVFLFSMPPDSFSEKIYNLMPLSKSENTTGISETNVEALIRQLTNYLAEKIFDGKLKAGGRIDSDRSLSETFNVSRTAVREALKVLQTMGMVDIRPSQGSFLCKDTSKFFVIPLSWSIFLNEKKTQDILELRNTLEIEAAKLAANCTNAVAINKLTSISYEMHSAYEKRNYKQFLELDLHFHEQIAICSENQIIYNLTQTLRNLICKLSSDGMVNLEQLSNIYNEHRSIYGFIITHDSAAAGEAMKNHLENSVTRY